MSRETITVNSTLRVGPDQPNSAGKLVLANSGGAEFSVKTTESGAFSIENGQGAAVFRVSEHGEMYIGNPNVSKDVYLKGEEIFSTHDFKIPDNVEISGNQLSIDLQDFDVTFIPNGDGAVIFKHVKPGETIGGKDLWSRVGSLEKKKLQGRITYLEGLKKLP